MLRLTDSYATVFKPEVKGVKGNIVMATLSSSEKIKNGDSVEYKNSYWNNAIFVSEACVEKAKRLQDRDRIVIKSGTVKIEPYEDKMGNKRYPAKVVVFDFELAGGGSAPKTDSADIAENDSTEGLPF